MFQIEVQEKFRAAHSLKLYDGKNEPKHSHLWKVSVIIQSEKLDSIGVVMDFEIVKKHLKSIIRSYHGKDFNKISHLKRKKANPSAENIAKWIFDALKKKIDKRCSRLVSTKVWEMPGAAAIYSNTVK